MVRESVESDNRQTDECRIQRNLLAERHICEQLVHSCYMTGEQCECEHLTSLSWVQCLNYCIKNDSIILDCDVKMDCSLGCLKVIK